MDVFLQVAVIGLAKSGIIALLAIGLVLVHRTTGVVNFAHWALGMLGVITYVLLTATAGVPPALAAVVALAVPPLVAVLAQRAAFARLRRADEVTMILVTLGVGALLAAIGQMALRGQRGDIIVDPFLPAGLLRAGDVVVTTAEIVTVGAAFGLTAALLPWLKRSRRGQALRAVAQNREAAALAGIDAQRYAELAWVIGAGLAGLSLLLFIPHSAGERGGILSAVHLVPLGSLLLPALGAGLVGGLISLPAAVGGALMFGLVQELLVLAPAPFSGERDLLTFGLVVLLLLLRTERFFASAAELQALRS